MIAYFILVHRYPQQFKRLFKAIYDPENQYLIHVDKRAGKALQKDVQSFLADFPNTSFLKSQNVIWGGYSMVEAELRGMSKLLKLNKKWDFFINLSGQDFPLKSQIAIQDYLKVNKGKNFLKIADQVKMRPNTLNRIQNYFTEADNDFIGTPIKRAFLSKITPYIGGQWKILSRECCEFICKSPKIAKFRNFYRHTLIPDESFFQTVLMNTEFKGKIINDDKRAIIWIPDLGTKLLSNSFTLGDTKSLIASGKIKLRPKIFTTHDLPFLLESKALFARKFDETVDQAVLEILESNLKSSNMKNTTLKQIPQVNPNPVFIQKALTLPLEEIRVI